LKIDDPTVLKTYKLSTIGMGTDKKSGKPKSRNTISPEVLSVERCVDLLQPGGYFAMVLPDAITNTKSKSYVRQFLLENVQLVACVDFPKETFEPGGTGTQTTVVIFQKPEDGQQPNNEGEIFMSIVTCVGYNRKGPLFKTDEYGEQVLDANDDPIVNNQIPAMVEAFRKYLGLGKAQHSLFDEYQG
jgi:type I restriction enzyme M protein